MKVRKGPLSYFNNIWWEFRYDSLYRVLSPKKVPYLLWGVPYYCVYQGQTLPTLNSWFFKISSYQCYYLDYGSSLTQWSHPVSGNHGNSLIRPISEAECVLQCLSEHLALSRAIFFSICLDGTFSFSFCAVCPVGPCLSFLGRISYVCLHCVHLKITKHFQCFKARPEKPHAPAAGSCICVCFCVCVSIVYQFIGMILATIEQWITWC